MLNAHFHLAKSILTTKPASFIWIGSGFDLSEWGTIAVDEYGATSREGVFAGGDVVNGASVVVEALADGKRAAQGIHKYLQERSFSS